MRTMRKLTAGFEIVLIASKASNVVPVDLQCLALQNPLGNRQCHPTLSWTLQDTVAGERGQSQTA